MAKIFISHAHKDFRLVERLHGLLKWASGELFDIYRSSKDGAIKTGENWYDWIDKRILECDIAVVVLTPSSFRGKWVMWEAGAVAGIQRERLHKNKDNNDRKVRALVFDVGTNDLGPFGREQTVNGLDSNRLAEFIQELLTDFKSEIKDEVFYSTLRRLDQKSKEFVEGAKNDLKFTPFAISEGLVHEWLDRIREKVKEGDYSWIVSAQRWINIAFLGAGNVNSKTPIDFRIHSALAKCHESEMRWDKAVEQLELATAISPNDLPILIRLGKALLEHNEEDKVKNLFDKLKDLDSEIFKEDREAITLKCSYLVKSNKWNEVKNLFASVSPDLISKDEYLSTWKAISSMKNDGKEESLRHFRKLKEVAKSKKGGFWSYASQVNACLALNEIQEASELLVKMKFKSRTPNDIESATRYFDEILNNYGNKFDWRSEISP